MSDSLILSNASKHSDVQARVRFRAIAKAMDVANEDPGITNHAERLVLARRILQDMVSLSGLCAVVLTNSTIGAAVSASPADPGNALVDGDVDFQLGSVWDTLALAEF